MVSDQEALVKEVMDQEIMVKEDAIIGYVAWWESCLQMKYTDVAAVTEDVTDGGRTVRRFG